jgi:hypothetical protein
MNNFTSEDFGDMQITKMSYNEETRGWTFFVTHNDNTYVIKDFDLPHPENVKNKGHLVSVVQEKMLMVQNKSTKEIVKQVLEFQEDEILYTPFTELSPVEYVKPEEKEKSVFLEYDGPGYENFFLDDFDIYKGNINIILNLDSYTWIPGKYMKSFEWAQKYEYRLVNVKGNKIKLFPIERVIETKEGTWEYWDGETSNILEFNGRITRDMLVDEGAGVSKYNIHLLLDTDTMTWNYGPNNEDGGWLGEGKQIYIQGIKVLLETKISELGYKWNYI